MSLKFAQPLRPAATAASGPVRVTDRTASGPGRPEFRRFSTTNRDAMAALLYRYDNVPS